MKLLCYCSSLTAASGYTLTEMDAIGNLQPCAMTPELSRILQQEGITMAIVYRHNDVFLALKRLKPAQNPPLDRTNSIIYVNLVFFFDQKQKDTMSALALYALEEPQEMANQLCAAYDHRANNAVGYSFDRKKVEEVLERAVARASQRLNQHTQSIATEPQQVDIQGACHLICACQANLKDCIFLVNTNLSFEQLKRSGVLPRYYITTSQSRIVPSTPEVHTTWLVRMLRSLFMKNDKLSLQRVGIVSGVLAVCIFALVLIPVSVLRHLPSPTPMPSPTVTGVTEGQLPLSAGVSYDAEVRAGEPIAYEVSAQGGELPYRFTLKLYAENRFVQSFAWQDNGSFHVETAQPGTYRAVIHVSDSTGSEYEIEKFTLVRDDENTKLFSVRWTNDNELCLTGFDRNAFAGRIIVIPSNIEGMKVTSIAANVFEQAADKQQIELPDSLEYIEDDALPSDKHLVLIYSGDSVAVNEVIREYENLFEEVTESFENREIIETDGETMGE